ncbi:cytochrome c oxidase cbb3-type subunit 3 [Neobacillus bataviensis]|uniref:Cytochrome c oxidase cbb3-type subunit 3 n=1 Tax=Neobacillus bataviensis TaxID=220685 RepID=A0A561DSI7_9BACI|nr:c-type cytochrome [Neobacillus bataviensis]TWE06345.1 cytochrome c oxidase cbb3-type subunit 3 [Neobacillus bataviensis]
MKKILFGFYILVIIGIVVCISNSNIFGHKNSQAIAAGERVYNKNCLVCHGDTGKGEGIKAGTALNNQNFLNSVTDKNLYNYIKYGRVGTGMPAYGPRLSEKDLKNIVAFIRNWQTENIDFNVQKNIAGDPANGKKLYTLYCQNCHMEAGKGMLRMGTALSHRDYLEYTTDKQIWISTAYGREETRMGPSLKGLDGVRQLKKQDISDIVSYIRSLEEKK